MELTDITADTSLDDILKSKEIENTTSTTYNSINKTISCRTQAIKSCMNTEGFNSVVEGEVLLKDSAQTVLNSYEDFLQSVKSTFNGIVSAAAHREYDELGTLRTKINEAIPQIEEEIASLQMTLDDVYYKLDNGLEENSEYYFETLDAQDVCVSKKEEYNNKLLEIEARISKLDLSNVTSTSGNSSDAKTAYINQIPLFEIGPDGRPTTIPPDFQVDSHHRLNLPGFGSCREATRGNVLEFHYNPETNMFYDGYAGEDWSNYDYAGDIYAITPEQMLNSEIAGGLVPF